MIGLVDFIKFISENYYVGMENEKVELRPYNNMQMKIISENNYDNYLYEGLSNCR